MLLLGPGLTAPPHVGPMFPSDPRLRAVWHSRGVCGRGSGRSADMKKGYDSIAALNRGKSPKTASLIIRL